MDEFLEKIAMEIYQERIKIMRRQVKDFDNGDDLDTEDLEKDLKLTRLMQFIMELD